MNYKKHKIKIDNPSTGFKNSMVLTDIPADFFICVKMRCKNEKD